MLEGETLHVAGTTGSGMTPDSCLSSHWYPACVDATSRHSTWDLIVPGDGENTEGPHDCRRCLEGYGERRFRCCVAGSEVMSESSSSCSSFNCHAEPKKHCPGDVEARYCFSLGITSSDD
ncbi:hypothetical protein E2C01_011313 [Portunus trituberculatus]|uniref:Uncharacterized protein n=1 Tax=Portunus trituberculatus TaxID=210409 RepID=A0A5B7DB31_PORTR|nr:hypothetical protein [Portunus trituberculatus]